MPAFLTPELLRRLEQFQLLAAWCVEFVAAPALTPTISPRRGRILRRVWTSRKLSVLRKLSPANHQPAAIDNPASESFQRGLLLFPLPGGEGGGEGGRPTNYISSKHSTSNAQRPTPNHLAPALIGCSGLKIEGWMFVFLPLTPRLHSHRDWTIVTHGSGGRHRGRRMGRVVCDDTARTLARQRRVVGALPRHRRFA